MAFIELHARSAFSFLRGASLPQALVERAAALGMPALALCDRDGVYGAPRFFAAAREAGLRPIVGCEVTLEDDAVLPLLVENRTGYQNLCRMLTRAHLRAPKGESRVRWDELAEFAPGLVCLTGDADEGPLARAEPDSRDALLQRLIAAYGPSNVFVEVHRHRLRGELRRSQELAALAARAGVSVVASNGPTYAERSGRKVMDVFTCLRHHTHLDAAGRLLAANSERFLKSADAMAALFADMPEALHTSVALAERLNFSLADLGYEFPTYDVPEGESMDSFLEKMTFAGARDRFGSRFGPQVESQLRHELNLIQRLGFAGYFLTVWDIVRFCREHDIMMQGRGSAANSAVCYSLGITAVDPIGGRLLFERFLSEGRKGWPDIDIDFPSGDRREQVIQEVFRRYGPHGAAMTATLICYRGRSAAREIGKTLNLPNDILDRCSHLFYSGDFPHSMDVSEQIRQAGLPEEHPRTRAFVELFQAVRGLPRHLGQHTGGMIICQGRLDGIVPLENAAMPQRVVAQWDKDDCEDLGIVKVDLLGLGMMAVLQDALRLCETRGHPVDLAQIPTDDPATFDLLQRADTVGVFQVESRAQMATLPRMKPRCFYDLVIEVAIIRPGPIQGGLLHPFLARRSGREPVSYIDECFRPILERTLGVPLFQEQVLQMAMTLAGVSASDAEDLRRALNFTRDPTRLRRAEEKLRAAMQRKGIPPAKQEQMVAAIHSFALYGFPESHAISFAILAYGSAYLKVHHPAEFYCGLLNNQPMGFYSPATLVKDAARRGLRIRPVDVTCSEWLCSVQDDRTLRLGLCVVRGLTREHGQRIASERHQRPFDDLDTFKARCRLTRPELRALARLGALNALPARPAAAPIAHRREALWQAERALREGDLFAHAAAAAAPDSHATAAAPRLQPMTLPERVEADYHGTGLTTGPHPMSLIRDAAAARDLWRAADLPEGRNGLLVRIGGMIICRQRPGTAKGVLFLSVEDETGIANAIVPPELFEAHRLMFTQEPFLIVEGRLQMHEGVIHVLALRAEPLIYPRTLAAASHDFH